MGHQRVVDDESLLPAGDPRRAPRPDAPAQGLQRGGAAVIDAPEGRPYAFLPVQGGELQRERAPAHDRFDPGRLSGWIELRLEALTPVTVLSGQFALDEAGNPFQEMARHLDQACLPGSTVRGVARSVAEACSPSCRRGLLRPTPACTPGPGRDACSACRTFGYVAGAARAYRSPIRVNDRPRGRSGWNHAGWHGESEAV